MPLPLQVHRAYHRYYCQGKGFWKEGAMRPAINDALDYLQCGAVFVVITLDRLAHSDHDLMQITQILQDKMWSASFRSGAGDLNPERQINLSRSCRHWQVCAGAYHRTGQRRSFGAMPAGIKFARKPKLFKVEEESIFNCMCFECALKYICTSQV